MSGPHAPSGEAGDAAPARAAPHADALPDDRVNILIVDDEPGNLMVLETVLDDPGYRLVRAQSGEEALMALVQHEFALLILDIRMPGLSGFELAHMIKQRRKTASVPIIFMTAYYDKDQHVMEGYSSGAVDFLSKPVTPVVLSSKVAVFVDLHRKSRAIAQANQALSAEIAERRRFEEELRQLNLTLEQRIEERTRALHAADLQLRDMMGSISDGLLMLDRDWCFTYANEPGARLLGRPPADLLGHGIWHLFPEMLDSPAHASYHRARDSGTTVSFEQYFPGPGRWFQCHCYPSDAGMSVYFLDINDRHEVELRREQLLAAERAARRESERVARAKEEFLASLSHELRTPLAAILGWTGLLRRPDLAPETLHRGLEVIARNAQAQSRLVGDLLDVSRIVSGKLRLSLERVDVAAIFAAEVEALRPAASAKRIDLRVSRTDGAEAFVNGDSTRLHQVASNLLSNALKFTPAGGHVTVVTRAAGDSVEVEVADSGEGIDQEFLPHLFERFSQGDGSSARTHGGLGLGLSIVKSLVEQHGGTIEASSGGKGQGASFVVRFPGHHPSAEDGALLVDPEAAEFLSGSGEGGLRGIQVLLVDDHDDMLELGLRLLKEIGAIVTTASSGEEALELLAANAYDALLSDLGMPGMDGYQLIRRVRSQLGLDARALPAAAVTAFVRGEDLRRALDEGFQTVLQKPITPARLVQTLGRLVGIPESRRAGPVDGRGG